ncbi:MAG TPA: TetR/AcrR family transcriptional regulator [Syntrophales bacterium]|nr:TetR/AcrR family transcriptional regulator [Syntrophales bacterium]
MSQKRNDQTKNTFSRLKEQERLTRREIILDAAERVFATTPFPEVNMRNIAREAGISAASIYTYFPDQETLFVEAYLRGSQNILKTFKQRTRKSENPLGSLIEAYIDYFTSHDVYFRMMAHFMLYARLNPESLEKLNTMERAVLDYFDTFFENMGYRTNVRFLSHMFFAALNGILISFRKYPGRSEDEVVKHMKRLGDTFAALLRAGVESTCNETRP